ncbi:hypothetical protein CONPUDRAFT_58596, partial [Coniophora puteana RWD-64-598 SS2]
EGWARKRLREDVRNIVGQRNIEESNRVVFDAFADEMIANVDMLRGGEHGRIHGRMGSTANLGDDVRFHRGVDRVRIRHVELGEHFIDEGGLRERDSPTSAVALDPNTDAELDGSEL